MPSSVTATSRSSKTHVRERAPLSSSEAYTCPLVASMKKNSLVDERLTVSRERTEPSELARMESGVIAHAASPNAEAVDGVTLRAGLPSVGVSVNLLQSPVSSISTVALVHAGFPPARKSLS